ncbi:uncharacterized protein LOC128546763 [Mercenaria mercenaria]|uniref:uncharacterized protein LOC128546763 n=1 Tax=Mercenaria mercenaria TaxID=6596 RepID=UPI00234EC02B|nr:uncharacterized protein LOC128546763 [Mercenaria mercenaria]
MSCKEHADFTSACTVYLHPLGFNSQVLQIFIPSFYITIRAYIAPLGGALACYHITHLLSTSQLHSRQVDSDSRDSLQTIALLEIYKSQRAIAYYLELAYLSFFDYPEIKKEVLTASQSAKEKHGITAHREWHCLVNELNWELEVLTNYRFSNIDIAIKCAYSLKVFLTEELQKSYIELQDIIRNLIKRCENFTNLHKHKEAKARNKKSLRSEDSHSGIRRMMIEKDASSIYSGSYKFVPKEDVKAYTFVLDKNTEIAKYSSKHYKGKPEMKIFKQEDMPSIRAGGKHKDMVSPGLKTLKIL